MILTGALSTEMFILVLVAIFVLGGILYALTGFIKVKKGHVAIIERIGNFTGIYKPGLYYFAPLLYRRVGMYKVGETKSDFVINRISYRLTYEIIDVKKFHYIGKHDLEGVIKASLKETNLSATLNNRFELIGVKFIALEKIKTK